METVEETPKSGDALPQGELAKAYQALQGMLARNDGVVSSKALGTALREELKFDDEMAQQALKELQFRKDELPIATGISGATTFHQGRSFFTAEKYSEVRTEIAKEAEGRAERATGGEEEKIKTEDESPQRRQEEARLGIYVKEALENIYGTDFTPEAEEYVFDVHKERSGGSFENVDLVAAHWRTEKLVDLVAAEVKLEFNAQAVQQACNYTRFCHRVWIAVPVSSDVQEASVELRAVDLALFEYAVYCGIGILGCKRRPGPCNYDVFPIHWPMRQDPDEVEKLGFVERYRAQFEKARVVKPVDERGGVAF